MGYNAIARQLVAMLLAGGSVFASHAVCAQSAAPEEAQRPAPVPFYGASSTSAEGVEAPGEIIVTARRRAETLQDTPISVSALNGEQLARAGITDVQGLQYRTPSLTITSGSSQRNTVSFSLRGQRTQETQLFSDPPVGTYFAEVVQPRPWGFGQSLYDLQSVQVVKGVQGTLFGRNMTGGAILVEPREPQIGAVEGEVRGQLGNYDLRDVFGVLNVPVGDTLALRVAGKLRKRDGWAHEVTTGIDYDDQDSKTFRISALWEPSDRIRSLTILDWFRLDENGTASFLTDLSLTRPNSTAASNIGQLVALFQAGLISNDPRAEFARAQTLRRDGFKLDTGVGEGGNLDLWPNGPMEKLLNWGFTNKTTFEISDSLTLKNIVGYRKLRREQIQDYDGIPSSFINPFQFARLRNISEELQLQGKAFDGRLTYIIGAYYFDEKGIDGSNGVGFAQLALRGRGLSLTTTPATLILTQNPGEGYSRTAAAFVAGTFKLTDQLSLSGGLRYNYDKRKITVSPYLINLQQCQFDIDAVTNGVQTVPFDQCRFTNSKTFKEWTYDGTLQWEPNSNVTAYASYRRGFRAGGFSTRANSFPTFEPFLPEFVNEYELGLKTTHPIGSGRLTTSTALFLQNLSNVQKQRTLLVGTQPFTVIDNTAKQRNKGAEFEATLSFPVVSVTAFYSYAKVRILEGRVVLNGIPEFEQRGSPKHQLGATLTVSPPIGEDVGDLTLTANATYRSKVYLDDFEVSGLQPGYTLINLRAGIEKIGRTGFSAAVFATNVTDKKYRIGQLGLVAEGVGFSASAYGEPRMYGIEVGYKF